MKYNSVRTNKLESNSATKKMKNELVLLLNETKYSCKTEIRNVKKRKTRRIITSFLNYLK
jgi:hypothetical protein